MYTHFCNMFVYQFAWASENQVGPVDPNRPLARGPVETNPNVAAWDRKQTFFLRVA